MVAAPTHLDDDGITSNSDFSTFSVHFGMPSAPIAASLAGSDYQFTGRPLHYFKVEDGEDTYELRLADHRRRMYDPHHGRWMQRDPLGTEAAPNTAILGIAQSAFSAHGVLVLRSCARMSQ